MITQQHTLTQLSGLYGIYPCAYRLFEVDDLITSTAGAMFGFLLFKYIKFLPSLKAKKIVTKSQVANQTQRFLFYFFDYMIFSFVVNLFTTPKNIYNYIVVLSLFFLIYYIWIPKKFGTTIMGKIFSLKLLRYDKKELSTTKQILFYGVLIYFPMAFSAISQYIVSHIKNNGIIAFVSLLIIFLWFMGTSKNSRYS